MSFWFSNQILVAHDSRCRQTDTEDIMITYLKGNNMKKLTIAGFAMAVMATGCASNGDMDGVEEALSTSESAQQAADRAQSRADSAHSRADSAYAKAEEALEKATAAHSEAEEANERAKRMLDRASGK